MAIGLRASTVAMPSLDRRRLLGIVLAAAAGLLVLVVTRPAPQVAILVADGDLVAGQPLSEDDVSVRWVLDAEGLVAGTSLGEIAEWSLRAPLAAGEPLVPSLLQAPAIATYPNVIALSLPLEHAVLGNLMAGDRVDVYLTTSDGFDSQPVTQRIASGVYVVEARMVATGINSDRVDLLLAVDETLAETLAGAARADDIDLVRIAP